MQYQCKNAETTFLNFILIIVVFLSVSGCSVKSIGYNVKNSIAGEHFLLTEQYEKGSESFQKAVERSPDSALANYYYGRFLLGEKQYRKALPYLKKASELNPDRAEYHFWTGLAYGLQKKRKSERIAYEKALALEKDHLQALIHFGHNRLQEQQYSKALSLYTRALKIWPASPTSLYNRALILTKLKRNPEAVAGWLEYLSYYPSGGMARKAVVHLNTLDNFSFRNYKLLSRTATVEKIYFEPFTATLSPDSAASLAFIGNIFEKMKKGRLQIVVYQLNNKPLAKQKALALKKFLLEEFPELKSSDIGVSWFNSPELLPVGTKKKRIDESVNFFITK